ncbi:HK97 gp10 family phage protein [Fusobacterium pseudoperiodonticum]|uniref:HK97 gp10 family phage protein n=1 Tax=Fusobacterium pseudoperiodonticum TaxID=2663009 RepID=UPI0028F125EC|nr:HK97 gp10 family phage protein [Fusobacterium pseudoperiodonticum]
MELKGFKEFDKILIEIKEKAPETTKKFLMLQAEDLKKDVKNLTPVDTGTLKNAWQRENGKRLTGNTFSQIVFNMTNYANHVEYGHRIGKSKTKFVKGKFMLRKALNTRQTKFYKDLKNFYGGLIKK